MADKSSAVQLALCNLGFLGGGAAQLIVDKALTRAVADTDDRGDDGKPRKVVITVTLQKMKSGMIEIGLEANLGLPVFRVAPTASAVKIDHTQKQAVLRFQPASPDNPEQESLDFDSVGEEK